MGLRKGWVAARMMIRALLHVRGLAALLVLLVAVAILRRGPEAESGPTIILHRVPAATATHGMPGAGPSVVERVLWRAVKADTVWITGPDLSPLHDLFCRGVVAPPGPDTSRLTPTPTILLLTAGNLDGRSLELYGVLSDGALWRSATRLREDHGGLRVRADADTAIIRERKVLRFLGLRPTLGAGGGVVCTIGGGCGFGGFGGVVLVR